MFWHGFPLTSVTALKGTAKQFASPMTQALTWDVGNRVFILFPVDISFSQSRTSSVLEKGAKTYMIKPLRSPVPASTVR